MSPDVALSALPIERWPLRLTLARPLSHIQHTETPTTWQSSAKP